MTEFADRQLSSLSDGESQRIMLARALAQDTPVILLDEPTFLDIPNRIQLINLLADLAHNHGKCILFSTHELDLAISSSDSLLLIDSAGIIHLPAPQMEDYLHANAIFS